MPSNSKNAIPCKNNLSFIKVKSTFGSRKFQNGSISILQKQLLDYSILLVVQCNNLEKLSTLPYLNK